MAKPRKPKNEESKPDSSGALVRHQKLCLSIDIEKRLIYGYTELEIAVPDIGIVGLHAENLGIESVFVDGEPTEFEYYPHVHPGNHAENDKRWSSVSSPASAADFASSAYISALERELVPNLLINCCKVAFKAGCDQQEHQLEADNGVPLQSSDPKQNVKLVRINYWVEKTETGIHVDDTVLHTDNQLRRARCWFPCMDDNSQRCCYDLEFTVAHNLVAVSTGSLLYQVLSKDDPSRKTYVYRLNVPVAAQWISLSVASFEILPDSHISIVSHMCSPDNFSKLQNTVEFFHNAFSHYENYLSVKFPFGSYKQVFVAPEMAISSLSLGASVSIFSSQVLFDEKTIDQTIDTWIKLAYALARQWFGVYITPEAAEDEWLLDGIAGFLTDTFIKQFLGNNEARYRRYKANCAVCRADDTGVTALCSTASCKDLYGTQCIGLYGKIRSWKSVAILQMLEKQMGPEYFRKILQTIVSRAHDTTKSLRSLSTKEFRHFANKIGNLERPFLKEFFPRWVGSCGCPVLRMGLSYNKRKNMVELAVLRGCTAVPDSNISFLNANPNSENRDGDIGWPGMMSIRVHELDNTSDYPILTMAGDSWQLVEIQCHSKLATRRFQKPKKGLKPDGSDDNGDATPASSAESPLLWIRADPEMEYLAEIHFNQPVQMWINQLEKDKDVVAQSQAVASLVALPQISFSVVGALNNFLCNSKAFWRVRIDAAYALANTASEETDWAGLLHLVNFFKSRRFDANIGLPKPNDFHDIPEYFVLEAIPHAIAMVRTADNKSPREAVEFVLQLLKYNDNSGNPYSDVFWLAALLQSVGELEFGPQSIPLLSSLLKHIDRILQFDRLMPSHNGILTICCIRTLSQLALKLSGYIPLDRVLQLIRPFRNFKTIWQVRIEASRALLDLEFHCKGIDATLLLFIMYLEEEPYLRGQAKLAIHAMRLCQLRGLSDSSDEIRSQTLLALLHLLEGREAFNNIFLRHHIYCILQVLATRPPTLYGVPRDRTLNEGDNIGTCSEQKNMFGILPTEIKPTEPPVDLAAELKAAEPPLDLVSEASPAEPPVGASNIENLEITGLVIQEVLKETDTTSNGHERNTFKETDIISDSHEHRITKETENISYSQEQKSIKEIDDISNSHEQKTPKEVDTTSISHERRMPIVKFRVKHSATTSKAGETDNRIAERSQGGNETNRGGSSSVSVDAPPPRNFNQAVSISTHNHEEVNSFHDQGSHVTASICSAKFASDGNELGKELQCTADSSKGALLDDPSSPSYIQDNSVDACAQKFVSLQSLSAPTGAASSPRPSKDKEKKKGKEKKRKGRRDDPAYLERKRLKKEKKHREKEIAKLLNEANVSSEVLPSRKDETRTDHAAVQLSQSRKEPLVKTATVNLKPTEPNPMVRTEVSESGSAPKFRIKIKNRFLNKS